MLLARLIPDPLVIEHGRLEALDQPLLLFGLHHVAFGGLLRPPVAVRHLGVEVGLVAALAVFVDPGDALQLPAQQVNLLEVAAALHLLGDQLAHPRLDGEVDPVNGFDVIPAVTGFPGADRPLGGRQQLRNGSDLVPLKVQVHGLPAGFDMGEE
ncbi:hypothetical protein D3C84_492160 [compost metagenome]